MNRFAKILLPAIVIIALVSFYPQPCAQAAIFEGSEGGQVGLCLRSPDDPACGSIDCATAEGQKDKQCQTEAQYGTQEAKTSLEGAGITHTETAGVLIVKYVNFALPYLALAAFVGFVVAGFFYVTAYGNEEQLTKAKKILIWSVVGLLLVIASYSIVQFFTKGLVESLR